MKFFSMYNVLRNIHEDERGAYKYSSRPYVDSVYLKDGLCMGTDLHPSCYTKTVECKLMLIRLNIALYTVVRTLFIDTFCVGSLGDPLYFYKFCGSWNMDK